MPNRLIDCLRRTALLREGGGLGDGQLLGLFVNEREHDAFAALLKRHGPMVMGVCRRILRNQHDAEDAFQATFLVFARKAGTINVQGSVAGWLYRVAYRTALEARIRIVRRRKKEQPLDDVAHPAFPPDESQQELLALLDKEIDRLPDKYRVPVVLCELEGMSRREAARTLGLAEGTLSWRLAQAKKRLAKKLAQHGLAISGGTLAAVMTPATASACLRASTVKAVTAGAVPAKVLALTEGVMKAMLLTKLKVTVCVVTLALMAGVGATGVAYRAVADEPKPKEYVAVSTQTVENRLPADDLEALRLEIEALRKSLQATRERVKTLEGEVSTLKGQRSGPSGAMMNQGGGPPGPGGGQAGMMKMMMGQQSSSNPAPITRDSRKMTQPSQGQAQPGQGMQPDPKFRARSRSTTEASPVSNALDALKKLRDNPGDKQAAETLERALKQLEEREKRFPREKQ